MRVVIFCHSLVSDWNHGNAHFLRGVASELIARGHQVHVLEPTDGWSRTKLLETQGAAAIEGFHGAYPTLRSQTYLLDQLDLDAALDNANLVLVHEWNAHELVRRIGQHRRSTGKYRLLFHDTHHRSVTDPAAMSQYDLTNYDGVLAFGEVIRDLYEQNGWGRRAWTWHEAADTRVFRPMPGVERVEDIVWIGNWGDEERTTELHEFLLDPVRRLGLTANAHGVRYPKEGIEALKEAGIHFAGWLPNYEVPAAFARHRITLHIPRRPYASALPGIPTIRPFEAMACGIPLVSAPWKDVEGLFAPGEDFLVARNGDEMKRHLRTLRADGQMASAMADRAVRRIHARHTCAHRVDELLAIDASLRSE